MSVIEAPSPEKRAQILAGAAAVFAEDGYEGASMSRIAAEANVSKGTLYNHFESKAALFAAYIEQACARHLGHVFETVTGDGDPAATLQEIAARMMDMLLSPMGLTIHRVVVAEAVKFPELARAFYEAGPARGIATLARWLAAQTRRGTLDVPDPVFAAEQFFALTQTVLVLRRRLNLPPEPTPPAVQRIIDAAVRMFLNTYAARLPALSSGA